MGYSNKNSYNKWRLTLLAGIFGGVGGVLVDADHILSAITGGAIPWVFLHTTLVTLVLLGCSLTLIVGLYFTLVLGDKDDRE